MQRFRTSGLQRIRGRSQGSSTAAVPLRADISDQRCARIGLKGREPFRCRLEFDETASYGASALPEDAVDMKFTAS